MSNQNRHPEGTSVGGQWAPGASGEVDTDLLEAEVYEPDPVHELIGDWGREMAGTADTQQARRALLPRSYERGRAGDVAREGLSALVDHDYPPSDRGVGRMRQSRSDQQVAQAADFHEKKSRQARSSGEVADAASQIKAEHPDAYAVSLIPQDVGNRFMASSGTYVTRDGTRRELSPSVSRALSKKMVDADHVRADSKSYGLGPDNEPVLMVDSAIERGDTGYREFTPEDEIRGRATSGCFAIDDENVYEMDADGDLRVLEIKGRA